MEILAQNLANYVVEKGTIKENERELYEYGFLIALEAISCIITCFIMSLLLHTLPEGILFFVIFIPLRSYAGGLHLDNYWLCFSLSCLTFFIIMLLGKYFEFSTHITLILLFILEITVYCMYPVENINRIVDNNEDKQFKKKLRQFLLIDGIMAVILAILGWYRYLQIIAMVFAMIVITMVLGKYKNKKYL